MRDNDRLSRLDETIAALRRHLGRTARPGAPGGGPAAAGLWWESDAGTPPPGEPEDGSVVRIVREDGVALLAERDDWSMRGDLTDLRDGAPLTDAMQRRWFVHDIDYLNEPPQRWDELVDIADRLIIFVAVPPLRQFAADVGRTRKWGDRRG